MFRFGLSSFLHYVWRVNGCTAAGTAPLLHIDVHGKWSAKRYLDLGMVTHPKRYWDVTILGCQAPLEEVWPKEHQPFVSHLKQTMAQLLDRALEEHPVMTAKGNPIQVDMNPALHGYCHNEL